MNPIFFLLLVASGYALDWVNCLTQIKLAKNPNDHFIVSWKGRLDCNSSAVDPIFNACNITTENQLEPLPTDVAGIPLCKKYDLFNFQNSFVLYGQSNESTAAAAAVIKPCIQTQDYCTEDGLALALFFDVLIGVNLLTAVGLTAFLLKRREIRNMFIPFLRRSDGDGTTPREPLLTKA